MLLSPEDLGPVVKIPIKLFLDNLVRNFNCYSFTIKGGFFTRLRFKEKKFVIHNLIGPQLCGKLSFNSK